MATRITHNGKLFAIIIEADFAAPGVHFFTDHDLSQQLAYMSHPAGHIIDPHIHNASYRQIHRTQEVLILRKGRLRVDFYDDDQCYVESRILGPGDVILLVDGGHGFEVIEEVEMIEVKQGPYLQENDKVRFEPIAAKKIIVNQ